MCSGLTDQGVAILCRSGSAEAANYVTFPALKTLELDLNLAALSDILFNKVKHLGRFLGVSREFAPNKLCFKEPIMAESGRSWLMFNSWQN